MSAQEKLPIVTLLYAEKGNPLLVAMRKLIDLQIAEIRVDNDTAVPEMVKYNQGKISVLIDLQQMFERGLPEVQSLPQLGRRPPY